MITILMKRGSNHIIADADYVEYESQTKLWIFKNVGGTDQEEDDEIVAVFLQEEVVGWIRGELPKPVSIPIP